MVDINTELTQLDGEEPKAAETPYTPVFKVMGDSKIPVSDKTGKFWQARFDEAKALYQSRGYHDRWQEAIRYYQNDQSGQTNKDSELDRLGSGRARDARYATENIVFANVSALVPSTYAKNPSVAFTAIDPADAAQAKLFEKLTNTLLARKIAPGVGAKSKMKRAVVRVNLTNFAQFYISYVRKEDASEQALEDIARLSERLKTADPKELAQIEAELLALDEKVSLLSPAGPKLQLLDPTMCYIDPDASEIDGTDARYMIIGEYMRTEYLRAMYGEKDENGEWKTIYAPTHVIPQGRKNSLGHDEDINNFTLIDAGVEHSKYGYKTKEEFNANCRTLVWSVWDKATRRVLLFNDKDWTFPLWVWDDPYSLSTFFPVVSVSFVTDPVDMIGRSEVMYYLDQQDEVNKINHERARIRHWAMSKFFFNKSMIKDTTGVQNFLTGDTRNNVFGLEIPEGAKLSEMFGSIPLPSTQFEGLFDARPVFDAINRLSAVTPVMRNVEYKTNTTNRAIESYEGGTAMRLDEKIDAIEDAIGDITRVLLEMCVQFMDRRTVEDLIGAEVVNQYGGWQNMTPREFHRRFNLSIVGGSTLKPTSKSKKEQALNMGQVLGQFASTSPVVVLVMLKALARAFSEDVTITDEDWRMMMQSIEAAITQQQQAPADQQQGGSSGGSDAAQAQFMEQIAVTIDKLPPQVRGQLGQAIAKGIPFKQIVQGLLAQAEGNQ